MIEIIGKLVRTSQRMRREFGRGPSAAELAEQLELSLPKVEQALTVAKGMVSMERSLAEQPDENAAADAGDQGLSPREERVLCMRFGIRLETDPGLERLGRQLLDTRKRIRDLEAKARSQAEDDEPG